MQTFNLSANIENGFAKGMQYIVTPNAQNVVNNLINGFKTGIHSYTIIGTYGTGKSSFLLALEADLDKKNRSKYLLNPKLLSECTEFEILNIVGDYADLSVLLGRKLNMEGASNSVLDELKAYYQRLAKENKFLLLVIDEFGKVLEHAAKNNPEQELYFLQKLAEFVNVPSRNILLITTLHQNFSSYAKSLNEEQRNEWTKVKGRFKELVFVEPVEQLLYLASCQRRGVHTAIEDEDTFRGIFSLGQTTKFLKDTLSYSTAKQLYPLDPFAAYVMTQAIQRYGQNERSLFSFLAAKGQGSFSEFKPQKCMTYNLGIVYDYIIYNFYSTLKDVHFDSTSWSVIHSTIVRAEGLNIWASQREMCDAIELVKAVGLLNLFGVASFHMTVKELACYAKDAMNISNAERIINELIQVQLFRYAEYKQRVILFEGTDVNIEEEMIKAGNVVPKPVNYADELRVFFNKRVTPVKAHFYQRGTPRFFDYMILDSPMDIVPSGDTDGVVELIFSTRNDALDSIKEFSRENEHALVFAVFNNTKDIIGHLYEINKCDYILSKVLIDKNDKVAISEVKKHKEYEELKLNKAITDNLFSYNKNVTWVYRGVEQKITSHRDFNSLISRICDEVYYNTPIMNNELFNKHKLSSQITSAKAKYLKALVGNSDEIDLGFDPDKFPPEKTIYYSLLRNTGLHVEGRFTDMPNNNIRTVWDACDEFLRSTVNKARRISELLKTLSSQPYKLKQGFLDFWIPTYFYMKRQDYSLYDVNTGGYIPEVDLEVLALFQKHAADYEVKAFAVDGIKLAFFNQYRKFINLDDKEDISSDKFVETIKPFFIFYNRLNEYTKHTHKFNHLTTLKFRDVLANAKDPEKAFFEDLPEALGYKREDLNQEQFVSNYCSIIQRAVKELRSCYTHLIDRIEERLVDTLGFKSYEYSEYIIEVRDRFKCIKEYLLTDKLKEFYHHVMTQFDNRIEWYQSICYTALDQSLDILRDEQEEELVDNLIFMFRECEKYSDIASLLNEGSKDDDIYAFDLVSTRGADMKNQTYRLPEKDKQRSKELEHKINSLLSGDTNFDICTLLSILNSKINL